MSVRALGRRVDAAVGSLWRDGWTVGVVASPIEEVIRQRRLPEPRWLEPRPPGVFYADPFPLRVERDRVSVLVEEYDYRSRIGHLAEIAVGLDGRLLGSAPALTFAHHASYPSVLRWDGELYCVPETGEAERASAYRWANGGWRSHAALLEGFPAVDPTLVEHDGTWWLFCTRAEDHGALYLFHADEWTGPWRPHRENPVKRDLGAGRPAGALVVVDGELYRPSQDCRRRYGGALALARVVELSERAFREEIVFRIEPAAGWRYPLGIHTINGLGGVTVVDGLRREYFGRHWWR